MGITVGLLGCVGYYGIFAALRDEFGVSRGWGFGGVFNVITIIVSLDGVCKHGTDGAACDGKIVIWSLDLAVYIGCILV